MYPPKQYGRKPAKQVSTKKRLIFNYLPAVGTVSETHIVPCGYLTIVKSKHPLTLNCLQVLSRSSICNCFRSISATCRSCLLSVRSEKGCGLVNCGAPLIAGATVAARRHGAATKLHFCGGGVEGLAPLSSCCLLGISEKRSHFCAKAGKLLQCKEQSGERSGTRSD